MFKILSEQEQSNQNPDWKQANIIIMIITTTTSYTSFRNSIVGVPHRTHWMFLSPSGTHCRARPVHCGTLRCQFFPNSIPQHRQLWEWEAQHLKKFRVLFVCRSSRKRLFQNYITESAENMAFAANENRVQQSRQPLMPIFNLLDSGIQP